MSLFTSFTSKKQVHFDWSVSLTDEGLHDIRLGKRQFFRDPQFPRDLGSFLKEQPFGLLFIRGRRQVKVWTVGLGRAKRVGKAFRKGDVLPSSDA